MPDRFRELQEAAIRFRDERDWEQFHTPKDLALGLQIEAAEVCELFLWKTRAEAAGKLHDEEFRTRLADELADVQVFLFYLAHAAGIDLPVAVEDKMAKNALKYPADKARGNARKYTEL